jgi:hypothetical protein
MPPKIFGGFFLLGRLETKSFYRARRNACTTIDAAVAFVDYFSIFHFKYFYRAGASAGATTNAFFGVNLNCHANLLKSLQKIADKMTI